MDTERLEVSDMCRGIALSSFFPLYLTRSYFSRCFCGLEASVARDMGKQLIGTLWAHGSEIQLKKTKPANRTHTTREREK
jgi:hypothetical protein